MSLTRLHCFLAIFILLCGFKLAIVNPDSSANFHSEMEVICNFPSMEFYNCASEFPIIPNIFKDKISDNNEDAIYFSAIGGTILNPANPVIIAIVDSSTYPLTCADSFWVYRDYIFYDGVTTLTCSRTMISYNPPIRIEKEAENRIINCYENSDSLFQDWLTNSGGLKVFNCVLPLRTVLVPANPKLIYSCNGNAEANVIFKLLDGCGIWQETSAEFKVIDTFPPILNCVEESTFDISGSDLINDINWILSNVQVDESCGAFELSNDFDPASILYNCDSIQVINVQVVAQDNCLNSSTCDTQLKLINERPPIINCPPDITINCSDDNYLDQINNWLNLSSALDFGNTAITVINDFDILSIDLLQCNPIEIIEFKSTDQCGRLSFCNSSYQLLDTIAPIINCPPTLDINTSDIGILDIVNDWALQVTSIDNCHDYQITNNINLNDFDYDCEDYKSIQIVFISKDDCNNISQCESLINITNDIIFDIVCFQDLILECGNPDNRQLIKDWAENVYAYNNIGEVFEVENDIIYEEMESTACDTSFKIYFKFEDECNSVYLCSNSIAIHDYTSPEIKCPDNFELSGGSLDTIQLLIELESEVSYSDICSEVSLESNYYDNPPDICNDFNTAVVTFTVSDKCGLTSNCQTEINLVVDKRPQIYCQNNLEVECGDLFLDVTISIWLNEVTGLDYNGDLLLSKNDFDISYIDLGNCEKELKVTFIVSDICNREEECYSFIKIIDTKSPELKCPPNLNIESTDPGLKTKIEDWLMMSEVMDDCNSFSVQSEFDFNNFNACQIDDELPILFYATDECNNRSDCYSNIIVNHTAPSIFCPQTINIECGDPNFEELLVQWIELGSAFDNFGNFLEPNIDLVLSELPITCDLALSVNFSTEDNCGVLAECNTSISISDTQSPIIICEPELLVFTSDSEAANQVQQWIDNTSVEDCNEYALTSDFDYQNYDFNCSHDTLISITLTVLDKCLNRSTCNSQISVIDNIELSIQCPQILEIECGDDINNINNWLEIASSNNSVGVQFDIKNDFDASLSLFSCDVQYDIAFNSTDNCNNSVNCISSIIIKDSTPPEIQCPLELTCSVDNQDMYDEIAKWLNSTTAIDACSFTSIINDFHEDKLLVPCSERFEVQVIFTAFDECLLSSNCNSMIIVEADLSPAIVCPPRLELECGSENNIQFINSWLSESIGEDNFGNDLEVSNSFNLSEEYLKACNQEIEILFQAIDGCQTEVSCTAKIFITDTKKPELKCPANINIASSNQDNLSTITNWVDEITADDNCSSVLIENDLDINDIIFCETEDVIEVIFSGLDECGNIGSCTTHIYVDHSLPIINCVEKLVLECGEPENEKIIDNWLLEVTSNDNNGDPLQIISDFSFSELNINCNEQTKVNFTATDICNRNKTCFSYIEIEDTQAPLITCPPEITLQLADPQISELIEFWSKSVIVSDLCSQTEISNNLDFDASLVHCSENREVLFVVKDECENINECNTGIFIENENEVSIKCPEGVEVICDSENIESYISDFILGYTASSLIPYEVYTDFDPDSIDIDCSNGYTQIVTFTISDICGNYDSCDSHLSFLPKAKIYIPNIFSPNGDGNNDRFYVYGNSAVKIIKSILVFDRWGNIIYAEEDLSPNEESKGWNGLKKDQSVVPGVYTYHVIIEDHFGSEHEFAGTITLIK